MFTGASLALAGCLESIGLIISTINNRARPGPEVDCGRNWDPSCCCDPCDLSRWTAWCTLCAPACCLYPKAVKAEDIRSPLIKTNAARYTENYRAGGEEQKNGSLISSESGEDNERMNGSKGSWTKATCFNSNLDPVKNDPSK